MKRVRTVAALLVAVTLSAGTFTPASASENLGGWAVVDPITGNVYGVIVGDWDAATFEQVKAQRTWDGYMGCPKPCELVLQTKAEDDGNVAGWHGTQTNVNQDGTATQHNSGSVKYDKATDTFLLPGLGKLKAGSKISQARFPRLKCKDDNYGVTWRAKKNARWDESGECVRLADVRTKNTQTTTRGNN